MPSIDSIEKAVFNLLEELSKEFGLDLTDPNFDETPRRVAKAYREIFSGLSNTKDQLIEILESSFPCKYEGMVLVKDIVVFSVCPHHLLPIHYQVHLAYIPSKKGHVLGLSKLPRIVELLAKRPVLQETFTEEITSTLMDIKGATGAACVVIGKHYCMAMRGVCKPDALTITPSLRGIFETNDAARSEFYSLVGSK